MWDAIEIKSNQIFRIRYIKRFVHISLKASIFLRQTFHIIE